MLFRMKHHTGEEYVQIVPDEVICINSLKITGKKKFVNYFAEAYLDTNLPDLKNSTKQRFNFDKIIPEPKKLQDKLVTDRFNHENDDPKKLIKWREKNWGVPYNTFETSCIFHIKQFDDNYDDDTEIFMIINFYTYAAMPYSLLLYLSEQWMGELEITCFSVDNNGWCATYDYEHLLRNYWYDVDEEAYRKCTIENSYYSEKDWAEEDKKRNLA